MFLEPPANNVVCALVALYFLAWLLQCLLHGVPSDYERKGEPHE